MHELPARFWAKVNKSGPVPVARPDLGPCWLWTGTTIKLRKGQGGYGNWGNVAGRNQVTHVACYEDLVGPVPPGFELDHLCRVRHCCRPSHLEPVTHSENVRRGLRPAQVTAMRRAQQAGKTHCPKGHAYDGANLLLLPARKPGNAPRRDCRSCRNARNRAAYAAKSALRT